MLTIFFLQTAEKVIQVSIKAQKASSQYKALNRIEFYRLFKEIQVLKIKWLIKSLHLILHSLIKLIINFENMFAKKELSVYR